MLTALLLIALFFGLVQEVRVPAKIKIAGLRSRRSAKRSALIAIADKGK